MTNRFRRRSRPTDHRHARLARAVGRVVEALENRVLLATDLRFAPASGTAFNVLVVQRDAAAEVVDAGTGAVRAAVPLAAFSGTVAVVGAATTDGTSDAVTFDPSLQSAGVRAVSVALAGGDSDAVTFAGNLATAGGAVTVSADLITVAAGAVLSTVATPSGAITFDGRSVTLNPGSKLLAGGASPAAVTIRATNKPSETASILGDLTSPVLAADRTATITATAATIDGGTVTLAAQAQTQTRWDDLGQYSDSIAGSLLNTVAQVSDLALSLLSPVSGQVKIQHATSGVVLTDTAVTAAGAASVTATSGSDSSFTTVGVDSATGVPVVATIGYGEATATANVELDGSTAISAAGDVTITSDTAGRAQVTGRGVGNGRLTDKPYNTGSGAELVFAVGVGLTTQTSTVSTAPGTRVRSAAGNVDVAAHGDADNEVTTQSQLFQNGTAGVAVSVSVDRATVTSTVNGTVVAANPQGSAGHPFDASAAVDLARDTVTFANVNPAAAVRRGDTLTYAPGAGTAIGGLVAGQTYTVADVATVTAADGRLTQTVHLANAATLDLDGAQTSVDSRQTLGRLALATTPATAVGKAGGDLTLAGLRLADGSTLTDQTQLPAGTLFTYVGPNSPVSARQVAAAFARSAGGDTITRADGGTSFHALGLFAGEQVTIADAVDAAGKSVGGDNGTFTVKAISADGNTLTLVQANALTTGAVAAFSLDAAAGNPPGVANLVQGTPYATTVVGGTVKLYDPAIQIAGQPIKYVPYAGGGSGGGVLGFSYTDDVQTFSPRSAVNADNGTVTVPGHGFKTGDLLYYHTDPTRTVTEPAYEYASNDATAPTRQLGSIRETDAPVDGMANGYAYYVTVVDANTVRLSESSVAAAQAAVVDLTANGTGTQAFSAPDTARGVAITATLDATNGAAAAAALSDLKQPVSDVIFNAGTNPENLLAGLRNAQTIVDAFREASATKSLDPILPDSSNPDDTGIPADIAGTVAVNVYRHTVLATVGPTAVIQSGADLTIAADVTEYTSAVSDAEATRAGDPSGTNAAGKKTGQDPNQLELSVAVAVAENNNAARATVSPNAFTDARGATTVDAEVAYPLRSGTPQNALNPAYTIKDQGLNGLSIFLDRTAGLATNLFNSWTVSTGGNSGTTNDHCVVGLGLDLQFFNNEATAVVGAAAGVNQDPAYQTAAQSVSVTAHTTFDTIDVGQISAVNLSVPGLIDNGIDLAREPNPVDFLKGIFNPLGLAGRDVVGPSVVVTVATNTTTAEVQTGKPFQAVATPADGTVGFGTDPNIRNGTPVLLTAASAAVTGLTVGRTYYVIAGLADAHQYRLAATAADAAAGIAVRLGGLTGSISLVARTLVHTGATSAGLTVDAATDGFAVAVDQTGAKSSDLGITASVTVGKYTDVTTADVGTDVGVTGSALTVTADDTLDRYGVQGAFVLGKNAGLGASVGVNLVARTTTAYLGADTPDSAASPVSGAPQVDVAGAVAVTAGNHGNVFDLGLAGAALSSGGKATAKQGQAQTDYGIGGSGVTVAIGASADVDDGTDVARAFADLPAVTAGSMAVTSGSDTVWRTVVVGGALDSQGGNQTASGRTQGGLAVGVGGAFAVVNLTDTADAFVRDATVALSAADGLAVRATDQPSIGSDGGGVAVAISRASQKVSSVSAGIGVAVNTITAHANAFLDDDRVATPAGGVAVNANYAPTINAVTVAGAGSVGYSASTGGSGSALSLAGAGAGTKNVVDGGGAAHVLDSRVTAGNGDVAVRGRDAAAITADAGAFALAAQLATDDGTKLVLSFDASVALNQVTDAATAYLQNSTVAAPTGNVFVTATVPASPSTINAFAIGGAVSAAVTKDPIVGAFSGAGTGNTVTDTVTAYVEGGSVTAGGGLTVTATDSDSIQADGGGFAIALALSRDSGMATSLAIGVGAAVNTIAANATAYVQHGTVVVGGQANVTATSAGTITALTMGGAFAGAIGSGAFTFAAAGAGSGNQITGQTVARFGAADATTGRTTVRAGSVDVAATDTSAITANGGGVAFALGIGEGDDPNIDVSFGVSVAVNNVARAVTAAVDAADVTAANAVSALATESATIEALTVAGSGAIGASSGGIGVALAGTGAGSGNQIANVVTAEIGAASTVAADQAGVATAGGLTVAASNTSTINAEGTSGVLAAVISENGGTATVGVSIAQNQIGGSTTADVTGGSTVSVAAGPASVTATSAETVTALTVAAVLALSGQTGAVSVGLGGAGAQTTNTVNPMVEATVRGQSSLTTGGGGTASVLAADTDALTATAGGGALAAAFSSEGLAAAVALSTAIAKNDVGTVVYADVVHATVTADGSVAIAATENTTATAKSEGVDTAVAITDPTEGFALALAGGWAQAENDAHATVAAGVDGRAVVSGRTGVSIRAADVATASADGSGFNVAVALGGSIAATLTFGKNDVADAVDAYVGNATVSAPAGGVSVTAAAADTVTGTAKPVSISAGAGAAIEGGVSSAVIAGHVEADLDAGAVVNAPAGEVTVAAVDTATASAKTRGGGIGQLSAGTMAAVAEVQTVARAAVDAGALVSAARLTVTTGGTPSVDPALSGRKATAQADGGSFGVISGAGVLAEALMPGTVTAEIMGGARVTVTGAVTVNAVSTSTVSADAGGLAAGTLLGGAVVLTTATLAGGTTAAVDAGAGIRAGSLAVSATAAKSTLATLFGAGAGLIAGGAGGKAVATDSADTTAALGGNTVDGVTLAGVAADPVGPVPATTVAGLTTVSASATESTATVAGGGAGGLLGAAAAFLSTATSSGSVRAAVADGAMLSTGALAVVASAPSRTVSATNTPTAAVGGVAVALLQSDATVTGDVTAGVGRYAHVTTGADGLASVTATSTTAAATSGRGGSGGLINATVFESKAQVGTADNHAVTAASIGDGAVVNTGSVTVSATATSSAKGDLMAVAVGILGAGAAAVGEADVTADTTALLGDGLNDGPTVTTTPGGAGGDVTVQAASTHSATASLTAGGGGAFVGVAVAKGATHVTADTTAGIGTGSQVNAGGSLSVLAESHGAAANTDLLAGSGGFVSVADTIATADSTPTVSARIGAATVSAGRDLSVAAIGRGEVDDHAESDGGGAIQVGAANADATYTPTVGATVAPGARATVAGNLGVSATLLADPALFDFGLLAGDGQSTAVADGGSGGVIDVGVPSAKLTETPTVTAAVDAARVDVKGSASVTTASRTNLTGSADTDGGGFVAVSDARARAIVTGAATQARIGDGTNATVLTAGGNVSVLGQSTHVMHVTAHAESGAFAANSTATDKLLLGATTDAAVGANSSVNAGGLVAVDATAGVQSLSKAVAEASGLGTGAYADDSDDDSGTSVTSPATVTVGGGATVTGDAVRLRAHIAPATANAYATDYNTGIPGREANARATVRQPATVDLVAGAGRPTTVTGTRGVDVLAVADPADVNRYPQKYLDGRTDAFETDGKRTGITNVTGVVTADAGVRVAAGTRDAAATPLAVPPALGVLSPATQTALLVGSAGSVRWDADVDVLAPSVSVTRDSTGRFAVTGPVTVRPVDTGLAVGDIADAAGPGQVVFTDLPSIVGVDTLDDHGGPDSKGFDEHAVPTINGGVGTITFEQALASVNIASALGPLSVGNITTYALADAGVEPKVVIDVPTNNLGFYVQYHYGPTAVTIADTDPSLASGTGVTLTGLIDNPLGTTTITSAGDIVAQNFDRRVGQVRTNRLVLTSTAGNVGGSIGTVLGPTNTTETRISVQLVELPNQRASAAVSAAKDVNLAVQGINRDPGVQANFRTTLAASTFAAGGSADIRLLGGRNQTTAGSTAPLGIQVFETATVDSPGSVPTPPADHKKTPRTTTVVDHFRDSTPGVTVTAPVGVAGVDTGGVDTTYDLGTVTAAGSINLYKASGVAVRVNIVSDVDVLTGAAAGNVSGSTDGSIFLDETAGDLRIGRVASSDDDVVLVSDAGSILDLTTADVGDPGADAIGVDVRLSARAGTVGTKGNPFDVTSSVSRAGSVDAEGQGDVVVYEVGGTAVTAPGDLVVGLVTSAGGDVVLRSQTGSIVEAADDAAGTAAVLGNTVTLRADSPLAAGIGTAARPLYIDSSRSARGGLYVYADGAAFVTEVVDELYVLGLDRASVSLPAVTLATLDDRSDRNDVDLTGPTSVSSLTVTAGDHFTQLAAATVYCLGTVTVTVDPQAVDADPGTGGTVTVNGTMTATELDLTGGRDRDGFNVRPQAVTAVPVVKVFGNAPYTFPGDTLSPLAATGTYVNRLLDPVNDNGLITFNGAYTTIQYFSIEQVAADAAPTIVGVYASSTAWANTFADLVDGTLDDGSALGYRVPSGAAQTRTLPWANIDQLKVRFSKDVGASMGRVDFALPAAPGWAAAGRPRPSVPGAFVVTYDSATFTATLQFATPIPAAVVDLTVIAAGVTDAVGTPLDGEWTNNGTATVSGNGTPGGNFSFRLFVLPGDTVDQVGGGAGTALRYVNTNDSQQVRDTQAALLIKTVGSTLVVGNYDPRADLDGSGAINTDDSQRVRDQQNAIIYPVAVTTSPVKSNPVGTGPVVTAPVKPSPVKAGPVGTGPVAAVADGPTVAATAGTTAVAPATPTGRPAPAAAASVNGQVNSGIVSAVERPHV